MKAILMLVALTLTGCGGFNQGYMAGQLKSAGNKEGAAWNLAHTEATKECPQGTDNKPLPRSKAIEAHNCKAKHIEKYVRPVAFSPTDLNQYLIDQKKIAIAYKNGKIDRDTANIKISEAYNNYFVRLDNKAKSMMLSAQQQDAAIASNMQQASQQLIQQDIQQQQSMDANGIQNTNCRMVGQQMNCTSW